jgi:hypothetical protein
MTRPGKTALQHATARFHPMKTSAQASQEPTHRSRLIDDIPIAMRTTVEADGAWTSRPMATRAGTAR